MPKEKTDPTRIASRKRVRAERARERRAENVKTAMDYTKSAMAHINTMVNHTASGDDTGEKTPRKYFMFRFMTFRFFVIAAVILMLVALIAFNDRTITADRQKVTVAGLSADLENYTILQISDLNATFFGEEQASLLRVINAQQYDIIVCTGDMVGVSGNAEPFYSLLRGLGTKKPVYFIAGNSDPAPLIATARDNSDGTKTLSQMVLADWVLGAMDLGAIYVDAPVEITVGQTSLWLTPSTLLNLNSALCLESLNDELAQEQEGMLLGIQADYDSLPFTNYRCNVIGRMVSAAASMNVDDMNVVLAHVPPTWTQISIAQDQHTDEAESGKYLIAPDLVLAGDYCGGVWHLPFYGAFYIPATGTARNGWFPDQRTVSGMTTNGGVSMYVSPGLGTTDSIKLPFRLLNQPQISLITLSGELPTSILDE